jgi:hypothetical protein
MVIEAAANLESREPRAGEEAGSGQEEKADAHHHDEGGPHFWLDPSKVIHCVKKERVFYCCAAAAKSCCSTTIKSQDFERAQAGL